MKIKQGFCLKNINGQNFVVCDRNINHNFNAMIQLSDYSSFLWDMLTNGSATKEEMLNALLKKFDISTILALNDINIFIKTLKENGILEE